MSSTAGIIVTLILALVLIVLAFLLGVIVGWWHISQVSPEAWKMYVNDSK